MNAPESAAPLNLEHYFMGFTHNRYFKQHPRLFVKAQGNYYTMADGRRVFDGFAGLWCCHAGHGHPKIVEAVQRQVAEMDYCPAFNFGHPGAFRLAERIAALAPEGLDYVFYANSGSEAVDSALKIALAYHRVKGQASRVRLIGRERGYHGVGFGGISVGGILNNRKMYPASMLPGTDHLPTTHSLKDMAFSRGQPQWGAHLADELERLVALHDASTIAAVIVEPMQGSTGVIVPPVGYLERLREICTRHGILLIFDEVITGFGRLGTNFAPQRFGVVPDLITFAKGVTNGVQPLGGVIVRKDIYDAFMTGADYAIEMFHGYTYSAHPVPVAAGLATLEVYREEGLFERARALEPVLEELVHALRAEPHVIDIRNIGTAAAIDVSGLPGLPGKRGLGIFLHMLEAGFHVRWVGDTIALAPSFTTTPDELEALVGALRAALRANA